MSGAASISAPSSSPERAPGRRLRVLCLTDSRVLGGAEAQMIALFRGVVAAGHQVRLLALGARFAELARAAGLDAHTVAGPHSEGALGPILMVRAARRLCRETDPDVLHTEGIRTTAAGTLALLGLRRQPPLLITVHNLTDPGGCSYPLAARILRATGGFLTTVSESERARYVAHGFPSARCRTVYNGVAIAEPVTPERRERARAELGLPAQSFVIAMVGRLSKEKGHAILMRALASMPAPDQDVIAVAAGEGPERPSLEEQRDHLGLAGRFRFLGFREDPREVFDACDVVALPSLAEAFPMALLEAMAAGLPVIATRVGGVPEMMSDGREGRLIAPGDSDALRAALLLALGDVDARSRWGAAGRATAQSRFSLGRMVSETLALYDIVGGMREAVR